MHKYVCSHSMKLCWSMVLPTRVMLNTVQELRDAFLKAFNRWDQSQEEQMAFWNTIKSDHTENRLNIVLMTCKKIKVFPKTNVRSL